MPVSNNDPDVDYLGAVDQPELEENREMGGICCR